MNPSSSDEGNNEQYASEIPYDGENMNNYSNNQENNNYVAPDPPTNDEIINSNSGEVTPDTPTNGINIETIGNKEEEKRKGN